MTANSSPRPTTCNRSCRLTTTFFKPFFLVKICLLSTTLADQSSKIMSTDEIVRISPRTGKPVRQGKYKAGPGRSNHGPAREPAPQVEARQPNEPGKPAIRFSGNADDAHGLLKAIYQDTSLPLYARMDAA